MKEAGLRITLGFLKEREGTRMEKPFIKTYSFGMNPDNQ